LRELKPLRPDGEVRKTISGSMYWKASYVFSGKQPESFCDYDSS